MMTTMTILLSLDSQTKAGQRQSQTLIESRRQCTNGRPGLHPHHEVSLALLDIALRLKASSVSGHQLLALLEQNSRRHSARLC